MRKNFLFVKTFFLMLIFSSIILSRSIDQDSISVYLVKANWHTGLMIPVNNFTIKHIPALSYFDGCEYVDIGWGDAEFYQSTTENIFLILNAIIPPTPTVIRIDGYKFSIDKVIEWREFAIQFKLSKENFIRLADFLNRSFEYDSSQNVIIVSRDVEKPIIFFKSVHYYFFMRTCNTWAAEAIQAAGAEIDTFGLVTAEQIYAKLKKHGIVLKQYN